MPSNSDAADYGTFQGSLQVSPRFFAAAKASDKGKFPEVFHASDTTAAASMLFCNVRRVLMFSLLGSKGRQSHFKEEL